MKNKEQLSRIIDNFDVNSGVYSALNSDITYSLDEFGEYKPQFNSKLTESDYQKILNVSLMSDVSLDESELAKLQFMNASNYDKYIGYYEDLYAGYVKEGGYRDRGSSGGLTSWILNELLKQKYVDAVIHMHRVDPDKNDGILFKYAISNTEDEVNLNAKSMYYPGELSKVLEEVKKNPNKKYAIVGIPEFITEVQLLRNLDDKFKKQIAYTVGLVCGHQKTAKYVESLAWQFDIKPGDLKEADFRVKQANKTAMNYLHMFRGVRNGKEVVLKKSHADMFGEVWGHGFFKSKFSDFTDNTFNENADIVLGDAWLPEYINDGNGTNIVIVRNKKLSKIVSSALQDGRLELDSLKPKKIRASQKGLIHHTRDELPYRIEVAKKALGWAPTKRSFSGSKVRISKYKKKVQDIRRTIRDESKIVYLKAAKVNDWTIFRNTMEPLIEGYVNVYAEIARSNQEMKHINTKTGIKKAITWSRVMLKPRSRIKNTIQAIEGGLKSLKPDVIRKKLFNNRLEKRLSRIKNVPDGATLTLMGYHNYGNILQRYALQEYLYKNKLNYISLETLPFHLYASSPDYNKKHYLNDFVNEYIVREHISAEVSYPAYVVGSDQVWRNWDRAGLESTYKDVSRFLLDFTTDQKNVKRVAYAASFGSDNIEDAQLTPKVMQSLKKYAEKFTAISMREDSGVDIVSKYWGLNSVKTIDPSMLLTHKDYSNIVDNYKGTLGDTPDVFMYILDNSESKMKEIEKLSTIIDKGRTEVLYLRSGSELPPIESWLRNIRDSKLFVTDSFHGVAFALLFNTPVLVVENHKGGISRIETILSEFNLKRLFISDEDLKNLKSVDIPTINWKEVNDKIEKLRQESGRWLLDNVENGK